MSSQTNAEAYLAQEQSAYAEVTKTYPRRAERRFPIGKQNIWYKRIRVLSAWLADNGHDLPTELLKPYNASVLERVSASIPLKYQYRGLNALRELCRANVMFPDVLRSDKRLKVLDLSAGGCGIYEVFTHYGHDVKICDYYGNENKNDVGHSYALIHDELGVKCQNFDGRQRPYKFKTNSFDLVLSYQAIDAYGAVEDWPEILTELLRIAKKSVGLVLNPAHPKTKENAAKAEDFVAYVLATYKAARGTCPETGLPTLRIDVT